MQKILNHDTFDFKNSAIINPQNVGVDLDNERKSQKKTTVFTVDSRDRDTSIYPLPSKYIIHLDEEIADVTSAEITHCDVPFKSYLINKSNCKFSVIVNSTVFPIEIPIGDYDETTLANMLKTKLTQTPNVSIEWTVDYDIVTDKFLFYSDTEFELDFAKKYVDFEPYNLGKTLGFGLMKYVSHANPTPKYIDHPHELVSVFRKNFHNLNYTLLKISGFTVHHSFNQIIDRTFAIIPEFKDSQNISAIMQPPKNFNPPIGKVTKLQISFVDRSGNLTDFQNHDHYFTLKFESFKHSRKYSSFIDMH
jgi:hypothetical protein